MSMFSLIAIILIFTLVLIFLLQKLKQPTIIAYIIAGTAISFLFPGMLKSTEVLSAGLDDFSQLGVSLLLFITGLGISPQVIKDSGKKSLIGWILQVVITAIAGFLFCLLFDLGYMASALLAIGLASSSTIVMMKVFEEKKTMMNSVFGKNALGISISQDVCIMILLMAITTFKVVASEGWWYGISLLCINMLTAVALVRCSTKFFLPKIMKKVAVSQEFLMLFALGWCFLYGVLFDLMGFGMEIGSLIAGIVLAGSVYKHEVVARIKSLKDFFLIMFFVLLGARIGPDTIINIPMLIGLIFFIFIIKPLIVGCILGMQQSTKKNAFLSALCFTHISEFTFIVMAFWLTSGIIQDPSIDGTVTLVGLITIMGSGYFIKYGNELFKSLGSLTRFLPGRETHTLQKVSEDSFYELIIFGYSGMGKTFYDSFVSSGYSALIVDWNPNIIEHLLANLVDCRYGDMGDIAFLESLHVEHTKMAISTNKSHEENLLLLKYLKSKKSDLIIILPAETNQEALELYELGADHIILPFHISANQTSSFLQKLSFDPEKFLKKRSRHIQALKNKHADLLIEELRKTLK